MQFKALQIHYTSCRRGQAGGAGFQVRAVSPGLTADDIRACERRGSYRPPLDRPSAPTEDDLAVLYPRALRSYALPSGKRALTLSSYVGTDFSGRWGNFFAHTLVIEGKQPGLWPIDYYEWSGWKYGLRPDEDTEAAPPPLPPVDLGEIGPAASFTPEQLSAFLTEVPGREKMLASMVRAMLRLRMDKRPLVIRDSELRGLFWIACLQKSVGWEQAQTFSWSTYQFDPRSAADVVATTGDTDFRFDEQERAYQFRIFDLSRSTHSPFLPEAEDYGATVAGWMTRRPELLAAWHEFLDCFEVMEPTEALEGPLRLFRGLNEPASLTAEQLQTAAAFVEAHGRQERYAELLAAVTTAFGRVGSYGSPAEYTALVMFLARGARTVGTAAERRLAVKVWMGMFDNLVLGSGTHVAEVLEVGISLQKMFPDAAEEFSEGFRSGHPAARLAPAVRSAAPEVLHAVLTLAWGAVTGSPWEDPWFCAVAAAALERPGAATASALSLLKLAGSDSRTIVETCAFLAQGPDPEAAGVALASLHPHPELPPAIRNALGERRLWAILYAAWLAALERFADKRAVFERHYVNCLCKWPAYGGAYLEPAAREVLRALPTPDASRLALAWLKDGVANKFPFDFGHRCIIVANHALALGQGEDVTLDDARLVQQLAERRHLDLRPNHARLRLAVADLTPHRSTRGPSTSGDRWAGAPRPSIPPRDLADALEGIGQAAYESFLLRYLAPALDFVTSRENHLRLLEQVLVPAHVSVFRRRYLEVLKIRAREDRGQADDAALLAWISIDRRPELSMHIISMREEVMEALEAGLDGYSKDELSWKAQQLVTAPGRELNDFERNALWNFFDRAARPREGILGRIFGRRTSGEE